MGTVRWAASRMTPGDVKERANCPLVFLILNISLYRQKLSMGCRKAKATQGNEPFSTAERSERVENFLFRATRKYTEAGIEQETVAMRCQGANSPEPHRRGVPESDTSALRATDQQLHNRTSLTSWAHHGSFVQVKRYCAVQLAHPPHPLFADSWPPVSKLLVSFPCIFSPPVCIIRSVTSLSLATTTCTSEHPFFSNHCYPNTSNNMTHVSLEAAPFPVTTHGFFLQRGCCCQGKEVVPVHHIGG